MSSNLQPLRKEKKEDDTKGSGLLGLPEARAEFLFSKAKQLYELGRNYSVILEKVVTTTLKAISFATENSEYYNFLATVYLDACDLSSSLHCLRYAVKINPKDPIARERIGEVLFLIGQEILIEALKLQRNEKHGEIEIISKARAYFEECIQYDASNKKFWIFKCLCHIHCGQNEILMAQEAINQAVRLDNGEDAEILILRSKILISQNLISQGNAELRLAEIIEPNHPEVILFNERIHVESENLFKSSLEALTARSYQEAIKLINHCINLSCKDIKLYITKAKILRLYGDLDEGMVVIQQAADMYINASITEECTNLESFSTDNSEYNMRRQLIKLPEDMKLQKNLLINDMAIRCAEKGDYLRSIALLNTAMNHANFRQEMLSRSAVSSSIENTDNISNLNDRMEQDISVTQQCRYLMNRGDCYRALTRLDDAEADYRLAINLLLCTIDSASHTDTPLLRHKLSVVLYVKVYGVCRNLPIEAVDGFNAAEYSLCESLLSEAITLYPKVSDYYLNRGKARYYLSHFKEAQEDFRLVQKMVPLGMEVNSFIQQYSNDFQDFQDLELTKTTTNPKSTTKNERNSGHKKSKKIEEIVDFNSTIQSAFSVEGRNSLPKVRQNNYQNNYQNEKKIPQNILSSKLLKPLIKSDALKIRKTR